MTRGDLITKQDDERIDDWHLLRLENGSRAKTVMLSLRAALAELATARKEIARLQILAQSKLDPARENSALTQKPE